MHLEEIGISKLKLQCKREIKLSAFKTNNFQIKYVMVEHSVVVTTYDASREIQINIHKFLRNSQAMILLETRRS